MNVIRWASTAAAVLTVAAVAGCGAQGGGTAPTPGIDHCLVGSWRSTDVRGTISAGGSSVVVSGGAGELITVAADGSIRTDDSSTAPVSGTAADGSVYTLSQTGSGTGRVSGGAGRLTVTLDQPTALTVTLFKGDTVVATQHPGSATDAYTCAAGSMLTITGSGGTVSRYVPA